MILLRILSVALIILLTGCTSYRKDTVRVAGTNYSASDFGLIHITEAHRFGRFVYSKSESIFYDDRSIQGMNEIQRDTFLYERDGAGFEIKGPAVCFPGKESRQFLTRAFDTVLSSIAGWPVSGLASMDLATSHLNNDVTRVLRNDASYDLRFKAYCNPQATDVELWKRAMILLHESTHATLRLAGATPRDRKESERIAMGGEACLLLALASLIEPDDPAAFLTKHEALQNRITYYYGYVFPERAEVDLNQLCQAWQDKLRSTQKVLSRH